MTDPDRQIEECIAARRSFVMDAGAGAGKTYSLVLALGFACKELEKELTHSSRRIACVTYTKVARDEIIERTGDNPLIRVSTLHDFLWSLVRSHQRALKRALVAYNAELPAESSAKCAEPELVAALTASDVSYSDRGTHFLEGRIHHDDLIAVAAHLFNSSPLLARVAASQYPCILVDEYQDADERVVRILVDRIAACESGLTVVGLFGDKYQSIYDDGVGELPEDVSRALVPVIKADNRRCSVAVIDVLNRLRTDITQFPAHNNRPGDVVYLRVAAPGAASMAAVRSFVQEKRGWLPEAGTQRELYLTHRLIARKGGYEKLLAAFATRGKFYLEKMRSGEEPRIAFLVDFVEALSVAWSEKRAGAALTLLRKAGFELASNGAKSQASSALDRLQELRATGSIREVLEHLRNVHLLDLPDEFLDRLAGTVRLAPDAPSELLEREERESTFFAALFQVSYSEVIAFSQFLRAHTPYATKHGVKGEEYDTVFVVLDDAGARWNNYSFSGYLSGSDATTHAIRFRRTRNLFYVCCSRARVNLAVVDLSAKSDASKRAAVEAAFGKDHCFDL